MRSLTRLPFKLCVQSFASRGLATQSQAPSNSVNKRGWSLWSKASLAAPPTILTSWILLSDEPKRRARVAYNVPVRVFRDAVTVISIASGTAESVCRKHAGKMCHQSFINASGKKLHHCSLHDADYKLSLTGLDGDKHEQALKECHSRSAFKLQRLCFANGGIYIKLGQHVAQLVQNLLL